MLTQERLKEVLHYEPESGEFTRIVKTAHNASSGTVNKITGYLSISLGGRQYYGHRLAFLYMTGAWPQKMVDHINGNRSDNRWANLREASATINQQNLQVHQKNNRTGLLGVTRLHNRRGTKHFCAQLFAHGKRVHCTYHETPEAAHAAYLEAKRKHHEGNTL